MKTLTGISLFFTFAFAGCNPIDAAIDCNTICSRYSSCHDAAYDVAACAARCRSSSANNADYRRKANECDACIFDRACTSATFKCALQCTSIVP